MNDEDDKAYSWETEYERTWEGIREDEHGLVAASVEDIIHKAKRRFVGTKLIEMGLWNSKSVPKTVRGYVVADRTIWLTPILDGWRTYRRIFGWG